VLCWSFGCLCHLKCGVKKWLMLRAHSSGRWAWPALCPVFGCSLDAAICHQSNLHSPFITHSLWPRFILICILIRYKLSSVQISNYVVTVQLGILALLKTSCEPGHQNFGQNTEYLLLCQYLCFSFLIHLVTTPCGSLTVCEIQYQKICSLWQLSRIPQTIFHFLRKSTEKPLVSSISCFKTLPS
jgi:hypothetical protein